MKVIVAEDDEPRRAALAGYFRSLGHTVFETDMCSGALAHLEQNPDVRVITWDGSLKDDTTYSAIGRLKRTGFKGLMVAAASGHPDRRQQIIAGCSIEVDPTKPASYGPALDKVLERLLSER